MRDAEHQQQTGSCVEVVCAVCGATSGEVSTWQAATAWLQLHADSHRQAAGARFHRRIVALGFAVLFTGLAVTAVLASWPLVIALFAAAVAVGILIAEAGRPWIAPDPDPQPSRLDRADGHR